MPHPSKVRPLRGVNDMRVRALLAMVCVVVVAAPAGAFNPAGGATARRRHQPAVRSMPRPHVMDLAAQAYRCGRQRGEIERPMLTVIDYSLPSTEPRLWVIDMRDGMVLYHELVAHGRNSGHFEATRFSNHHGSKQSSLGLFRAEETYRGRHGYSLRMSGLESGVNDNARDRAIVIHGADYVSRSFIARHGRLGRSWGCPALPREVSSQVIDVIKGGSAVFAYYPDDDWLRSSRYLRCSEPL